MNRSVAESCCLIFALVCFAKSSIAVETSAERIRSLFERPPVEYRSAPLVVWNDDMTEEKITDMLVQLKSQGVWQLFVHPRPGLVTPYLSERWFDLYEWTLTEAERLGMRIWIYDENSYPSGFAGGHVPDQMPESVGLGLDLRRVDRPPEKLTGEVLAVHRVLESGNGLQTRDVTDDLRQGKELPEGTYWLFFIRRARLGQPWYGGFCYVDLLRPGVTEKFLEITLEAYHGRFGEHFGKLIPGSFTDEPHLRPAGGIHWSEDFLDRFQSRWGYSLRENLPSLFEEVGDWKRVRYQWHKFLLEEFIKHWAKPYYEYCQKHNLNFTGHYWEHSWPNCNGVPDNMAMAAWQQIPGIDCLMNQYREDTHAQFGNVRAVKEVASIANQLGRDRVLCEAYGASGWDFDFQSMKRIADWLCVLGVNLIDQHLAFTTIRGARKRDHPPSFTYHEPWWPLYHVSADYLARMMLALSAGRQRNRVLVIEPTTSAWMYLSPRADHPRLAEIGDQFQQFLVDLESEQLEYDLGCEEVIERHGSTSGGRFTIGERSYDLVVLPPGLENLNRKTANLLRAYLDGGGQVISLAGSSIMIDASPSDEFAAESEGKNERWLIVAPDDAASAIRSKVPPLVEISRDPQASGKLFHHLRLLDDGKLLFLVNTSLDGPAKGTATLAGKYVERWDLATGEIEGYPCQQKGKNVSFEYMLHPAGSLLLCISSKESAAAAVESQQEKTVTLLQPVGDLEIRRDDPNVLTLDFCDVSVGGDRLISAYFHRAQQLIWSRHGFKQNSWERAVQFKDTILKKDRFEPDSGFEAVFRFVAEGFDSPPDLSLVVEQPHLYSISVNGREISWDGRSWWLDKSFGRLDISTAVKNGENVVRLLARPFSIHHELEPVYILGDFALTPAEKGFVIVPPKSLKIGPWSRQGLPLYGHRVSYTQSFEIPSVAGRVVVSLGSWRGSVASVTVNGEQAGTIGWQPWELDVTEHVRTGRNTVTVTVYGTLKNTLGPHHGNPSLGTAWPGMFQAGPETGPPPGNEYSVVEYGLFEPFRVERRL